MQFGARRFSVQVTALPESGGEPGGASGDLTSGGSGGGSGIGATGRVGSAGLAAELTGLPGWVTTCANRLAPNSKTKSELAGCRVMAQTGINCSTDLAAPHLGPNYLLFAPKKRHATENYDTPCHISAFIVFPISRTSRVEGL